LSEGIGKNDNRKPGSLKESHDPAARLFTFSIFLLPFPLRPLL
jgi:hypothetical protein